MNGTPPICDDNPQWLSYLFQGKPRNCAAEEPQQLAKRSTELGRRSRLGPWLPGRREEKSILREKPSEFHVDVPSNQSSDSCWGWPTPRRPSLRFARVAGLLWRQASTSHKEWLRHIYLNHVRSSGDGCEFKIINDTSHLCRYIYIYVLILLYTWLCTYIYIYTYIHKLYLSPFHQGFISMVSDEKVGLDEPHVWDHFVGCFIFGGGIAFEKVWFSIAIWGLSQTCSIPSHDLSMFIIVFPWELL